MTTLNKLPHVKPDLVRVDENWEEWSMADLIDALQKWLRRSHVENSLWNSTGSLMGEMLPALIFCLRKETLFHYGIKHLCITVCFRVGMLTGVNQSKFECQSKGQTKVQPHSPFRFRGIF